MPRICSWCANAANSFHRMHAVANTSNPGKLAAQIETWERFYTTPPSVHEGWGKNAPRSLFLLLFRKPCELRDALWRLSQKGWVAIWCNDNNNNNNNFLTKDEV